MLHPALIVLVALYTYIISTGSAAGAVPLGVFVLSNETTSTITKGLNLLKSILITITCFFQQGL